MNEETINSIIRYNERATKEIERLKQKNNNLQSKIDKVIEKCQNTTYYQWDTYRDENFNLKGEKYETNLINKSEILDILKENK